MQVLLQKRGGMDAEGIGAKNKTMSVAFEPFVSRLIGTAIHSCIDSFWKSLPFEKESQLQGASPGHRGHGHWFTKYMYLLKVQKDLQDTLQVIRTLAQTATYALPTVLLLHIQSFLLTKERGAFWSVSRMWFTTRIKLQKWSGSSTCTSKDGKAIYNSVYHHLQMIDDPDADGESGGGSIFLLDPRRNFMDEFRRDTLELLHQVSVHERRTAWDVWSLPYFDSAQNSLRLIRFPLKDGVRFGDVVCSSELKQILEYKPTTKEIIGRSMSEEAGFAPNAHYGKFDDLPSSVGTRRLHCFNRDHLVMTEGCRFWVIDLRTQRVRSSGNIKAPVLEEDREPVVPRKKQVRLNWVPIAFSSSARPQRLHFYLLSAGLKEPILYCYDLDGMLRSRVELELNDFEWPRNCWVLMDISCCVSERNDNRELFLFARDAHQKRHLVRISIGPVSV